jgi:hypothetical protein
LISLAVFLWIPVIRITPAYPYILLFMYALTLVVYHMLIKTITRKLSRFVNAYMLVNFGKLILFSVIILVYAWFNREDAISFILTFFIYYLLFTTYEVIALLKASKSQS